MKIKALDIRKSKYYRHSIDEEHFDLNPKYREILKLHAMLMEHDIPHIVRRSFDGWQVCYPVSRPDAECVIDAIEHRGSYGQESDLLEIMGLLTPEEEEYDAVCGYLTAENVFERIKKHWDANRNETAKGAELHAREN